jgi:hypothetical protein
LRDEDEANVERPTQAKSTTASSASSAGGQRATMPELVVDNAWKRDLENIIKRPSGQLPIHIDLGRLISKITIYNSPDEPVFQYQAPDEDDANNLQMNIIRFLRKYSF